MNANIIEADEVHVIESRAQTDGPGDVRRACLKLVWQISIRGLGEGHRRDHVPAALPGRHCRQVLFLSVEHADAGWAVNLVAAEYEEIAIEVLHIEFQVRDSLSAVNQHGHATLMRRGDDSLHGIDRSQRVRHVNDRYELRARSE